MLSPITIEARVGKIDAPRSPFQTIFLTGVDSSKKWVDHLHGACQDPPWQLAMVRGVTGNDLVVKFLGGKARTGLQETGFYSQSPPKFELLTNPRLNIKVTRAGKVATL